LFSVICGDIVTKEDTLSREVTMARPILPLNKAELRDRIYSILSAQEADAAALKESWEPVFDSLATVELLCSVEELLPMEIPASRIVRAGGYDSSSEAANDISERIAAVCRLNESSDSSRPTRNAGQLLQATDK
jgi:acyl carrier protein